jgi:hypothetical protein
LRRKSPDPARIGEPCNSLDAKAFARFLRFRWLWQDFPLCRLCLENSFSNHLAPRGSCIVIGGADLLERPHETVCPK